MAADSQGLDVENRVSKRPRVQFGEPFSKELEPDLQFPPAFNANVRHTLFNSLAPVHALGAAKHIHARSHIPIESCLRWS